MFPSFFVPLRLLPLQDAHGRFFFKLPAVQGVVISTQSEQFFMAALLHDSSVPDYQDQISLADGGQPVGDQEGGPVLQQVFNGVLNQLFGLGVDGGGGLVQDKDSGVGQHRSCKGDQLLFTGGEPVAAFADIALPAVFQLFHHQMGRNGAGRFHHFLVGGVQPAITDVFHNRTGEQMGALKHIADVAVEPELASLPVVPAVNEDPAAGGFKEAAGQVYQGGFAGAGFTYNGDGGAGRNFQAEVAEYLLVAVGILEGDVLKFNVAFQGLPVFRFRIQRGAVFFHHLRGIGDLGLFVQQADDPFNVGLHRDDLRQVAGDLLNGFKDAGGIGSEGRKGAQHQQIVQYHAAALPDDNGGGDGTHQQHQGDEDGVQSGSFDAAAAHVLGDDSEFFTVLILDHQGFGGFGSHDAFVVGVGDFGVLFADLPVPVENPVLEIGGEERNGGDNEHDGQRKLHIEEQHGCKNAQYIGQGPEQVHRLPGCHARDPVGITHDSGQNVSHWRGVVVGEGEGLQMGEAGTLHVPAQFHFNPHTSPGKEDDKEGLSGNDQGIDQGKEPESLGGILLDEVVNGCPLEKGQHDIHRCTQQVHDNDHHKGAGKGPQKGQQPLPDVDIKGFGVFFFVNSHG